MAQNGYPNRTGKAPDEYTTSIIGNRSVEFIRARGGDGTRQQPFLLVAATRAPHSPQTPAPWHSSSFPNATNPRTPAFNASRLSHHVGFVASEPPITDEEAASFDEDFRNRWRTLQSVDDLVEGIMAELEAQGLLNRTFIFYSSDNGFHMGHMNLGFGKSHHYEFDTRLPFLARGPLIVPGSAPTFLASNVDVAPTFVELSGWQDGRGGRVPPLMDGRSMVSQLLTLPVEQQQESAEGNSNSDQARAWRNKGLIEYTGLSGWPEGYPHSHKRLNDCPNNTWRARAALQEWRPRARLRQQQRALRRVYYSNRLALQRRELSRALRP